jgi:hypothetical protein
MAPVSAASRLARWAWRGAWAVGQAGLVLAIVYMALGGRQRDFRVPLQYSEDALEYLMQTHGTIQHGWWWTHPDLGAPGVFEQLSYPSNTNVDQAIVWIVHLVTSEPGLTLNSSWMLMVALSSLVATACLRLLGISRATAVLSGVLYALLPYALSRNIQHFSLAIYLVPIPCAGALAVASGRVSLATRGRLALVAGCVLLGFNYAYYAFFGAFVLIVGTIAAAVRDPRSPDWRRGLQLLAAIVVATAVNLAPSLRLWAIEGQPLAIPAKTAAESELYGLKIRQLVSPVADHPFPPFARWASLERRAAFPSETENTSSRLGLVASIGFIVLLGALVLTVGPVGPAGRRWMGDPGIFAAAGGLVLALVLLGTIGGFGSLFSLLVSPAIRSYNRVCPFIAFYAWVGVALMIDALAPRARLWRGALVAGVLGVGVWDQIGALAPLNRAYAATRTEWTTIDTFVRALEPQLPPGAMVFQLPLTTYLNDEGYGRMRTYDEIKPSLASRTLHWSYPALDNSVVRWQHAVARLPPQAMAQALRDAGFRAIVIDRDGYADAAQSLIDALTVPDRSAVLADSAGPPGYVALDLTRVAASGGDMAHLPTWTAAFGPVSGGLPSCADPPTAHIDGIGPVKAPASGPITVERASTYAVRGWAVDDAHHALAGDVDLVVDGRPRGAFYGVNRPDIAARASRPEYRFSGVIGSIPAADLAPGPHRLSLRVVSSDRGCASDLAALAVIVPPVF